MQDSVKLFQYSTITGFSGTLEKNKANAGGETNPINCFGYSNLPL
jgi:hypothetical protein